MSAIVYIARYIILSLSLIFAIAVLGLSGRATDASILFLGGIAPFEIINLVVAPLTIVALSIIQITAIQGLAWTVWVLLMGYTLTLGIMARVATSRGIPVWSKSVKDATFSPASPNQGVQMAPKPELQANHQHAHLQLPLQANHQQPILQGSAPQNNPLGYGVTHANPIPSQTPAYPQV
ncbi:hypothetical protein EYR40_008209 [Pleurotus pulmonarius]|nr:hypothetical protein EYR40_008209 [Pleurotus pulmonarius]